MTDGKMDYIIGELINDIGEEVYQDSVMHGLMNAYHGNKYSKDECRKLLCYRILEEVIEAVRAIDNDDEFFKELSDVLVMTMVTENACGGKVGENLVARINYNRERPYMHKEEKKSENH